MNLNAQSSSSTPKLQPFVVRDLCCDCGKPFTRTLDESWKIRCFPCFKKSKEESIWRDRVNAADQKIAKLEQQLRQQALTIKVLLSKMDAHKSSLETEIQDHWRTLIQLVHPDKHNGSEAATRATQWLLSVKKRLNRELA